MKKLIIWDFDGVVADTEKLWLENIRLGLNRYCEVDWDFDTVNKYLGGQSWKRKMEVLAELGIFPPQEMTDYVFALDTACIMNGFGRTEGIDDILAMSGFQHAMATGGDWRKTILKLKAVGLDDMFKEGNLVTADMVQHGKPHPESFLLAAKMMQATPDECLVIEDSLAGLTAAVCAQMTPICFMGAEMYQHDATYLAAVKSLGVSYIFDNMSDLKIFLQSMQG